MVLFLPGISTMPKTNSHFCCQKVKTGLQLPGDDATINILVNILRDNRLKGDEEYELLGAYLYNALFDNNIGEKLHAWRNDAGVEYVKIELNFYR